MNAFRKILFWLHLVLGCVAGVVIFILCLTGAFLVFQGRINRALQPTVEAKAAPRLTLDEALVRLRQSGEDVPFEFVMHSGPTQPLEARWGHTRSLYLDPWTAEILPDQALANNVHSFLYYSERIHNRFGGGLQSAAGAFITQTGTFITFILLLSGIYLWFPDTYKAATMRIRLLFNPKLKGRLRDWNWHNVIGFWTLIPMLLFVLTAMVWSYDWAREGMNVLFSVPKVTGGGAGHGSGGGPAPGSPAAMARAIIPSADALAQAAVRHAEEAARAPGGAEPEGRGGAAAPAGERGAGAGQGARGGERGAGAGQGARGGERGAAAPRANAPAAAPAPAPTAPVQTAQTFVTEEALFQALARAVPNWIMMELPIAGGAAPMETMVYEPIGPFQAGSAGMVQIYIRPTTGEITKFTPFAQRDMSLKLHAWVRGWHTGSYWGIFGELIALITCLGACVVIFTGYTLSIRRYINYRNQKRRKLEAAAAAQKAAQELTSA